MRPQRYFPPFFNAIRDDEFYMKLLTTQFLACFILAFDPRINTRDKLEELAKN